ncbi:DUF885 domain-containing protein [Photobacterium swingsii]|uniref:DUF885 domain-containing protein n=1 Tax=Photobacterium swingsii TaxID=680026 RepID=A0A0J8XUG1_9GAMM|nr:DUF885 domain-containing protein [Photobacterium swingsii]KMV29009.1 hypothetical protein AB733_20335 [Photobacterium swingsii]PSW22745.1 DUF885 domain-containing protein [Photobacterium swingsii]
MKQRYHRLSVVTASIIAALALSGCNDDDSSNNGSDAKQAKAAMHTVFDGFTSEIKKIDDTPLGQVTDQMAKLRQEQDKQSLTELEKIDRSLLSDEDKIYYDTFKFDRELAIRGGELPNQRFGTFDIPSTHFYNYIESNAEYAGKALETVKEYQDHLAVVQDYTRWVTNLHDQYIQGQVEEIQLPKVLVKRYVDSSAELIKDADDSMLKVGLTHLKTLVAKSTNKDDQLLALQYERAVDEALAASKAIVAYLGGDYQNSARGTGVDGDITDKNIGWGDLPNGKVWYQWQLDRNSTTGKSADELNKLGEDLVADAKAEMERVARFVAEKQDSPNKDTLTAKWLDDKGDEQTKTYKVINADKTVNLSAFFDYLNSEAFFYGRDGRTISGTAYAKTCEVASSKTACEAALTDYYKFKNDANDVVAKYFKAIKTDYKIVPIAAERELYDGVASYSGSSTSFNLNTNPKYSLQKWNVSTLLLHEAAPGHHFQNAYSLEYPPADKPEYIKGVWYTAYAEGWALYTEWLGLEMGIYGDLDVNGKPTFVNGTGMCKTAGVDYTTFQGGIYKDAQECNAIQYFGSLNEAQLRNMRLAVDTGIHAKGWSIQEARDYMDANSALGDGDIASESFRYAAYVGQAVSYKSGYLVIKEMLEKAQSELGSNFSWIEFHDQLLKYGDQPMEVVETSITNWIASKK